MKYKKFGDFYNKHNYKLHDDCNEKIILKCQICGKEIKSIPALTTHVLRHHNVNIDDYIFKYLENLTPNFKYQKCGFCDNDALPTIHYNFKANTYKLEYDDGYMCKTSECIDKICIKFFNMHYSEAKSKYEHIGAKSEFLALKYKTSIEDIKFNVKRNKDFQYKPENTSSLEGYILRYGKIEGTKKYHERCQKISKSMKVEWYIERFGIIEGTKRYQERIEKTLKNTKDITKSKHQYEIFNTLKEYDNNWEAERFVGGSGIIDMVNKKLRFGIEYFGDYWHCNPLVYKDNFYNKSLSMTTKEKNTFDKQRLNKMLLFSKEVDYILVIWEKSFLKIGLNCIINKIYDIIKQHQYGKKEILWI